MKRIAPIVLAACLLLGAAGLSGCRKKEPDPPLYVTPSTSAANYLANMLVNGGKADVIYVSSEEVIEEINNTKGAKETIEKAAAAAITDTRPAPSPSSPTVAAPVDVNVRTMTIDEYKDAIRRQDAGEDISDLGITEDSEVVVFTGIPTEKPEGGRLDLNTIARAIAQEILERARRRYVYTTAPPAGAYTYADTPGENTTAPSGGGSSNSASTSAGAGQYVAPNYVDDHDYRGAVRAS